MVRHLTGIDVARKGLQVSQIVEKGTVVSFAYRSAISARDDLKAMLKRMKQEKRPVLEFILIVLRGGKPYMENRMWTSN